MADSPSSSIIPSGSPSPTGSSTSSQRLKKRTRASKPKVRTGCITWIRRVKCGEEKPQCLRCTSTGRICDGYDPDHSPSRARIALDPIEGAELAKSEFLKACQWSEALRVMRPLAPDLDGSKMSCNLSHHFRPIAADPELCAFADLWNRLAPQAVGDHPSPQQQPHDPAIRHAIVALGAAYQLYRFPGEPLPDGFTRDSLEIFAIQQYNQSIARLQPHVRSSQPDSIRVTLVCCLAFIFLETLHANHSAAITHLINGLKILQSLPPATVDFFLSASLPLTTPSDTFTMADIIRLFGRLEASACFFPNAIRPVVALHGYRTRLFDDGTSTITTPTPSLLTTFHRDVMAYLHSTSPSAPPTPLQHRQHASLLSRSAHLATRLSSTSPTTLPPTTLPSFNQHISLLHFHAAQLLLAPDTQTHHAALHHATLLHASPLNLRCPMLSTPLSAPLYLLAFQTAFSSPEIHAQAVRMLAETLCPAGPDGEGEGEGEAHQQQQHGDGGPYHRHQQQQQGEGGPKGLAKRISKVAKAAASRGGGQLQQLQLDPAGNNLPRALTGLGCLPGVWDAIFEEREEEEGDDEDEDWEGDEDEVGEAEAAGTGAVMGI